MLNVRIPDDLRDLIDAVRGDVPRERWIRRTLEAALSSSETPEPPRVTAAGTTARGRTPKVAHAKPSTAVPVATGLARQRALNDAKAKGKR